MKYLGYLILRWIPIILAIPVLGLAAIFVPGVVLSLFDLNALWVPIVASWVRTMAESLTAAYVFPGAWKAINGLVDGVSALYKAFVTTIHALTSRLPKEYGAQSEVFVRGYLVEGWLVIAEISAVLRWTLSRMFFR